MKRNIPIFFLCLLFVFGATSAHAFTYFQVSPASNFAGGNGTCEDPYRISSAGELAYFRNMVNQENSFEGAYFQLTNNIRLNQGQELIYAWAPIQGFAGDFDGNGYTISGIYVPEGFNKYHEEVEYGNRPQYSVTWGSGLFAELWSGGRIHDLTTSGLIETPTYPEEQNYAGGIAALMLQESEIRNCTSYMTFYNYGEFSLESRFSGIATNWWDARISDCVDNSMFFADTDAAMAPYLWHGIEGYPNCRDNSKMAGVGAPKVWNVFEPGPSSLKANEEDYSRLVGTVMADFESEIYTKDYTGQCVSYAKRRFEELTGVKVGETAGVSYASQMLKNNEKSDTVTVVYDVNSVEAPCMAVTKGITSANHVVVVEYVERDSNGKPVNIYFTEANNSAAKPDGKLQCYSFADFINKKKPLGYIIPQ